MARTYIILDGAIDVFLFNMPSVDLQLEVSMVE